MLAGFFACVVGNSLMGMAEEERIHLDNEMSGMSAWKKPETPERITIFSQGFLVQPEKLSRKLLKFRGFSFCGHLHLAHLHFLAFVGIPAFYASRPNPPRHHAGFGTLWDQIWLPHAENKLPALLKPGKNH